MFRVLFFRLSPRRAVGTLIGGLIILTLILTALGMMVFVSQQYDQYQQTVNQMAHYQDQAGAENLVAVTPGMTLLTSTTVSGWGSGCTTTYNCYNMSLSNLGGVGVQIMRIYINSTGSGCIYNPPTNPEQPCIFNPTSAIAPYAFNQANQFLNTGEVNHGVVLALPSTVTLPGLYYSQNTISIVTSRGDVFSFQWPFPIEIFGGQSQSAFSVGTIKVAYQDISTTATALCSPPSNSTYGASTSPGTSGCDSSHDYYNAPRNGAGYWPNAPYCHNELETAYVAQTNYAEKLTGITGVNGNTLYFVNPWITLEVLEDAATSITTPSGAGETPTPNTQLYLYINITNTGNAPYTVAGGTIDLTFSGSTHIDGTLIGIYYNPAGNTPGLYGAGGGVFYAPSSTQTVAVGKSFYAIFEITILQVDLQNLSSSSMFWGSLSLTNNIEGTGFVGGVGLSSGFWIRYTWLGQPNVAGWHC